MSSTTENIAALHIPQLKSTSEFYSWKIRVQLIEHVSNMESKQTTSQKARFRLELFESISPNILARVAEQIAQRKLHPMELSLESILGVVGGACNRLG